MADECSLFCGASSDGPGLRCASGHFVCLTCIEAYLKVEAEERRAQELKCPCCPKDALGALYSHAALAEVLSGDSLRLFQKSLDLAARGGSAIWECPQPGCPGIFEVVTTGPDDTPATISCPMCFGLFCSDCRQRLDAEGENFDHRCPAKLRRGLQDALSIGSGARCPTYDCAMRNVPMTKSNVSDCNVIRCPQIGGCGRYVCYLCDMDLGTTNDGAHALYPHRKKNGSFQCPLFNSHGAPEVARAVRDRQKRCVTTFLRYLTPAERREVADQQQQELQALGINVDNI